MRDWCLAVLTVAVIVLLGCLGHLGFRYFNIEFVDNVPSVVKVDGKKVYEGSSAGFDLESSGANTTVMIRSGFLYYFPKAYYTSKNVEVIGEKR